MAVERSFSFDADLKKSANPADIVEGDLRFVWHTNAYPAMVTQEGDKVTYLMGDGSKTYEPARVGPPHQSWPKGVGIYVLAK